MPRLTAYENFREIDWKPTFNHFVRGSFKAIHYTSIIFILLIELIFTVNLQ